MQALEAHYDPHIKELLAWEQLADGFQVGPMEEPEDPDEDRLQNHSTYIPNPAAAENDSAPKELNLDRCSF